MPWQLPARLPARRGNISLDIPFYRTTWGSCLRSIRNFRRSKQLGFWHSFCTGGIQTIWRTVLARIRAMLVVLTSERRIVPSHQVELPMPDSDGRDHGGVNGGNPSETMPLFACDRMLVTNPIARRGTSGLREPLAACEPCDHPRQQTSACFFI